jgi:7-carboxy-7-deazaguanine synthase
VKPLKQMPDMNLAKQLIKANPTFTREINVSEGFLEVSEFFCDTIQGENNVGYPAAFLRLQHCTLNCIWCDSQEVWRYGNAYNFNELFLLMEKPEFDLINKFSEGQHLVLTGGSPLKQQFMLASFISKFIEVYGFKPYIEIENECVLLPAASLIKYIDCWNNSPKLENSMNNHTVRYNPRIIAYMSQLPNSFFKFVVSDERDWKEIKGNYLEAGLIKKSQIVLMPEGQTREKIENNRNIVLEIAIRENVRYTTREHIIIWDKMTGV